jgi:hypothetical protein
MDDDISEIILQKSVNSALKTAKYVKRKAERAAAKKEGQTRDPKSELNKTERDPHIMSHQRVHPGSEEAKSKVGNGSGVKITIRQGRIDVVQTGIIQIGIESTHI